MITRNVTEFRCDLCGKSTSTTEYVHGFNPKIPDGMIALLSGVEIKVGETKKEIVREDKLFCSEQCFTAFLIDALSLAVAEIKNTPSEAEPEETAGEPIKEAING